MNNQTYGHITFEHNLKIFQMSVAMSTYNKRSFRTPFALTICEHSTHTCTRHMHNASVLAIDSRAIVLTVTSHRLFHRANARSLYDATGIVIRENTVLRVGTAITN